MLHLSNKAWLMVGVGFLLIWLIWFWNADRFVLPERNGQSALPFYLRADIKLARRWTPFNRGSLRLLCTTAQKVHLVLQSDLPGREYLRVGTEGKAILLIEGRTSHELSFQGAGLIVMDPLDTVLTESLSADQLAGLADWMDETWLKGFHLTLFEQGVGLAGFVRGNDIRRFVSRCVER